MAGGEPFAVARLGALRVEHRPDVDARAIAEAVARHRALARERGEGLLAERPRTAVTRLEIPTRRGVAVPVVVKETARTAAEAALDLVRGSPARRALRAARLLLDRKVATPTPIACADEVCCGIARSSAYVCRAIDGARTLSEWLAADPPLDRHGLRALARALGRAVGALHAAGVYHPDLKHLNVLARRHDLAVCEVETLAPVGFDVYFIDLDAVSPWRRLTWRRRVKNLAQLEAYASHEAPRLGIAHRARFLSGYLRECPSLEPHRRRLWRAVKAEALEKLLEWEETHARLRLPFAPGRRTYGGAARL